MGPLISLFWTSGDVCPGFQSQARFLTCVRCHRRAVDSSDSPLVPNLLTSSRNPLHLYVFIHVLTIIFLNTSIFKCTFIFCLLRSIPDFTYPVQTERNQNMEVLIPQFPSWQVTPYYATGPTFSHAMYSFFGDVLDLDLVASTRWIFSSKAIDRSV